MAFYLDIGVVRIQEYILRTAGADEGQLRKRRGASQLISEATDTGCFAPFGFELNDETYDTEGVAHLRAARDLGDGVERSAVVDKCLASLRKKLPQAHLSASWADADSYADADREIKALRGGKPSTGGVGLVEWVPPVREESRGLPCKGCGRSPRRVKDNCSDCAKRDDAGRRLARKVTPTTTLRSPASPEIRTMERMVRDSGVAVEAVADLGELARLNPWPTKKQNQLATIYADANNVGVTFDQVELLEDRKTLSNVLTGAIEAGADAALDLLREKLPAEKKGAFPASVTVLAADDVLITVPASLGWLFVETLIAAFDEHIDKHIDEASTGGGRLPLSLSAGIVFSHAKRPIEHTITLAGDVLKTAKKAAGGKASSIGWHDLTQHGVHRADARKDDRARSHTWFVRRRPVIEEVAGWPAHQRNKWTRDLADDSFRAAEIAAYLRREANRLGLSQKLKDLLDEQKTMGTVDDLIDIFEISRWWSTDQNQGEEQ